MSKEGLAEATLPVASLDEALLHLRRPFAPAAVKFKLQSTWGSGGLVVAYIDARLVVERLNAVVGGRWEEKFESAGAGGLWCHLTIKGVTHSDIGTGRDLKSMISD